MIIILAVQINADKLEYIPILTDRQQMAPYLNDEFVRMVIDTYEVFYPKVGYYPPWIGYLAIYDGTVVGVGGYKGPPVKRTVEIAYGSIPKYEGQGVSTQTCRYLTRLALTHAPDIRVIARTLMSESASTSILRKNGFVYVGIVDDPEDGDVWEWEFKSEGEKAR